MYKYILISGVNGAGKSTLFHILNGLDDMPRVNTDEIVKQFGDWNNTVERVKMILLLQLKMEEQWKS